MTESTLKDPKLFTEKVGNYLETHQKIVTEFEASLRNSRQFLELANLSLAKEPEHTGIMLEEIKNIDLIGHLTSQYKSFQEIADLIPHEARLTKLPLKAEELNELRQQYEDLIVNAEEQQTTIDKLLTALQNDL